VIDSLLRRVLSPCIFRFALALCSVLAGGLLFLSAQALATEAGGQPAGGPTITSLDPNHGPTSGGTTVTINGEPLENARSVHFGTVEGKILHEECDGECEIVPYRMLVVESPPHEAGTVDVTVEMSRGGVSLTSPVDQFTYSPPIQAPPSIEPPRAGSAEPSSLSNGGQPPAVPMLVSSPLATVDLSSPAAVINPKPKALTSVRKLAKALKVCDKKPKKQRPSCKKQAEQKYATTSKRKS
jgi:hypothetical protein